MCLSIAIIIADETMDCAGVSVQIGDGSLSLQQFIDDCNILGVGTNLSASPWCICALIASLVDGIPTADYSIERLPRLALPFRNVC
jgi:hypothetical protein